MASASTELSLALARRGYRALPELWERAGGGDVVRARLLGRPALVVRGPEGARLLYDDEVVRRRDAVPPPLARLLFGAGAVHGLDDEEHHDRKHLFTSVVDATAVQRLRDLVDARFRERGPSWEARVPFGLFDALVQLYGGSALRWAGLDLHPTESSLVSRRLAEVVDGSGYAPRAAPRAWAARLWTDRWARRTVAAARAGRVPAPEGTMLHALVRGEGADLPVATAATELHNLVRPTVAVAWLATHAAYMLLRHPHLGTDLADPASWRERGWFCEEVRRTAPFVPALAGRVRRPHVWHGERLDEGDVVVLDVPGTNHHARWGDPEEFRPARFGEWTPGPFDLVPQGGGEVARGHRCPGESVTTMLLDRTVQVLTASSWSATTSEADTTRIPTLPGRRLRIDSLELPRVL